MSTEIREILPQATQFEESIDALQKMVLGENVFQFEGVKEPLSHGAHRRPITLSFSQPSHFASAWQRSARFRGCFARYVARDATRCLRTGGPEARAWEKQFHRET